ncbi:hypothetical protein DFJ73DRAFT_174234 [Zopfochytrium polystomum]|nr:hypothetical protein DFJ73DRAFT_174234 [Zopfochytrium polystomum]
MPSATTVTLAGAMAATAEAAATLTAPNSNVTTTTALPTLVSQSGGSGALVGIGLDQSTHMIPSSMAPTVPAMLSIPSTVTTPSSIAATVSPRFSAAPTASSRNPAELPRTIGGLKPLPLKKSLSSSPRIPSQTPPANAVGPSSFSGAKLFKWTALTTGSGGSSSGGGKLSFSLFPSSGSMMRSSSPSRQPNASNASSDAVDPTQRGRKDFKLKMSRRRKSSTRGQVVITGPLQHLPMPVDPVARDARIASPPPPTITVEDTHTREITFPTPEVTVSGGSEAQLRQQQPPGPVHYHPKHPRSASLAARAMHIMERPPALMDRRKPNIQADPFPAEIWIRVISFLPEPTKAGRLCRDLRALLNNYHMRKVWFITRYGLGLSAFRAIVYHRSIVDLKLVKLLVKEGASIPRFLIQRLFQKMADKTATPTQIDILEWLVMEYSRVRKQISLPISVFEEAGHSPEGVYRLPNDVITTLPVAEAESLFASDDARLFDSLMNNPTPANMDTVRELVYKQGFVPLVDEVPTCIFRLFQMFCNDIGMFDHLVQANGLDLRPLNTLMLRWALSSATKRSLPVASPTSAPVGAAVPGQVPVLSADASPPGSGRQRVPHLSVFIARGFRLYPSIIISVLSESAVSELDFTVKLFSQFVSGTIIKECVTSIAQSMFGPTGTAKPQLLSKFVELDILDETVVRRCLLLDDRLKAAAAAAGIPYQSKCFEQSHPYVLWRWILEVFGPGSDLTKVAFDDLLLWLGDLPFRLQHFRPRMLDGLHPFELPYLFVNAGVPMRPHQVIHLARAARAPRAAPMPAVILEGIRRSIIALCVAPSSSLLTSFLSSSSTSIQRSMRRLSGPDLSRSASSSTNLPSLPAGAPVPSSVNYSAMYRRHGSSGAVLAGNPSPAAPPVPIINTSPDTLSRRGVVSSTSNPSLTSTVTFALAPAGAAGFPSAPVSPVSPALTTPVTPVSPVSPSSPFAPAAEPSPSTSLSTPSPLSVTRRRAPTVLTSTPPVFVRPVGAGGGGWADSRGLWLASLVKVQRDKALCAEIQKANVRWLEDREKRAKREKRRNGSAVGEGIAAAVVAAATTTGGLAAVGMASAVSVVGGGGVSGTSSLSGNSGTRSVNEEESAAPTRFLEELNLLIKLLD